MSGSRLHIRHREHPKRQLLRKFEAAANSLTKLLDVMVLLWCLEVKNIHMENQVPVNLYRNETPINRELQLTP